MLNYTIETETVQLTVQGYIIAYGSCTLYETFTTCVAKDNRGQRTGIELDLSVGIRFHIFNVLYKEGLL